MTRMPALNDLAPALAALALASALGGAQARPLALKDEAGVAAFAADVAAYRGASQVRWVVAARSHADAESAIAKLSLALQPSDEALLNRVSAEAVDPADLPQVADGPVAYVDARADTPISNCSWRVTVTDPQLPSRGAKPSEIGLVPDDSVPVGPAATFRLEHAGILQAKLYAFGETRPGAIRDLAAVADVNIPVAKPPEPELLLLATARNPSALYDSLKAALASAKGERRDLGAGQSLVGQGLVASRGISAGIATIPDVMIAPKAKPADSGKVAAAAPSEDFETCRYRLSPTKS